MRVSTSALANNLIGQLDDLSTQQSRYHTQISTGQRITTASDDPSAMRQVLDAQTDARNATQYKANVAHQQDLAKATYSGIKTLNTLCSRANELATLATSLTSQDAISAYTTEVDEIIKQAVTAANTKFGNAYVFSGTATQQIPFVMTTDDSGNATSVTYQGNEDVNQTEVSEGVTLSAQAVGASTSDTVRGVVTDSVSGADFFTHLLALRDHLKSGDMTSIASTDRSALQMDSDNLIFQMGNNGAIQSRLETIDTGLTSDVQALNSRVSNTAGTDATTAAVHLSQVQTAYQAALSGSNKILSMSLMDYLR